jgi:hypothetical protein
MNFGALKWKNALQFKEELFLSSLHPIPLVLPNLIHFRTFPHFSRIHSFPILSTYENNDECMSQRSVFSAAILALCSLPECVFTCAYVI